MTLKDILEDCYGIDFSTLKFKLRDDMEFDDLTVDQVKERLASDDIIVDGSFIGECDIYGDEPNGYLELYWVDDLVNEAEARCARMDW